MTVELLKEEKNQRYQDSPLMARPAALGEAFSLARIIEARFKAIAEKEKERSRAIDGVFDIGEINLGLGEELVIRVLEGRDVFGEGLVIFLNFIWFSDPIIINRAGCEIEIPSLSTVFHPDALALARRPGSNALTPSVKAFSMSIVPHTLSSVAPNERSSGFELNGSATTTIFSKSKSTSDRMVVDLPLPLSPMIIWVNGI
nr:hypothetical protein [Tanacetum cinerariifolium]